MGLFHQFADSLQKALINLSHGRSPYICQSQSLNLYLESPTRAKLSSMGLHFGMDISKIMAEEG